MTVTLINLCASNIDVGDFICQRGNNPKLVQVLTIDENGIYADDCREDSDNRGALPVLMTWDELKNWEEVEMDGD